MAGRTLLPLTIATWSYDRVQPLIDRRVRVAGCRLRYTTPPLDELFIRAFAKAEFDVTELSLSYYLGARSRGATPYVAIPVFPSRSFRHSTIYVRTDRGIETPGDLAGKRIGIREYQTSFAVLMRGVLLDEYGVDPGGMEWLTGLIEEGRARDMYHPPVPDEIRSRVSLRPIPEGRTLAAMLASGEIDALMANRPPSCFADGRPGIRRLFADASAAEQDYFARTRVFPIMHVVGVKRDLAAAHPWLSMRLFDAFARAKTIAMSELRQTQALKVMLPWLSQAIDLTTAVMGDDFWPYGIGRNRAAVETMLRYAAQQGICPRAMKPEELFEPGTLAT